MKATLGFLQTHVRDQFVTSFDSMLIRQNKDRSWLEKKMGIKKDSYIDYIFDESRSIDDFTRIAHILGFTFSMSFYPVKVG